MAGVEREGTEKKKANEKETAEEKIGEEEHRMDEKKKGREVSPREPCFAEVREEGKMLLHEGVPMVELHLAFPYFGGRGAAALNRFYGILHDACLRYAEGELLQISRTLYEEEPEGKRRFSHRRLIYLHACRIVAVGDFLSLRREISLRYRGRIVWERVLGEVVDKNGRLCPAAHFFSHKERRKRHIRMGDFYLDASGQPIWIHRGEKKQSRTPAKPEKGKEK